MPRRVSQPYLSLEAELHDAFWDTEDGGSEIGLMADFLKRHPGPALEIGAGSGRLMLPLAAMGFEIEGLELSPDMLALGRQRAAALGIEAPVHEGDMTTWRGGRPFASVLAPAFTLQLASDPETALRHWHGLLAPGGGLYLTVFMPYAELFGDLPEATWYPDHSATLPDGREGRLETRHRLDRTGRMVEREHRYTLAGDPPQVHLSKQVIRWIEPAELPGLLDRCGFRLDRWFADFDPDCGVSDPAHLEFDGILTCHATRSGGNSGI